MTCNVCDGTGFKNLHQIPENEMDNLNIVDNFIIAVQAWISFNDNHDVQVCDCCGDSEEWYGEPGEHYSRDDPIGDEGPYAYNGGLCECH